MDLDRSGYLIDGDGMGLTLRRDESQDRSFFIVLFDDHLARGNHIELIQDPKRSIQVDGSTAVFQVGKRRFARVTLQPEKGAE